MNRQINYKAMRVIVGLITILLAPTVYLLAGTGAKLESISISYWTDSHDIFVGALFAVGFFLAAYNGSGSFKDWEYILSKLACFFAVCIALFPTKGFSENDVAAKWISFVSELINLEITTIHYGSAIFLFVCLIAMMWFFSNRAKRKSKPVRALFYRCISILMGVGIVVLFAFGNIMGLETTILLVEWWGLTLFGIGWLTAGAYKSEPELNQ